MATKTKKEYMVQNHQPDALRAHQDALNGIILIYQALNSLPLVDQSARSHLFDAWTDFGRQGRNDIKVMLTSFGKTH